MASDDGMSDSDVESLDIEDGDFEQGENEESFVGTKSSENGAVVPNIDVEVDEDGNEVQYDRGSPTLDAKAAKRKMLVAKLNARRLEKLNELKRSYLPLDQINAIKYKNLKSKEMRRYVQARKKEKKLERKQRKKDGAERGVPRTIENTREPDGTMVGDLKEEDNAEVAQDIANDEFSDYFKATYEPKVLLTFCDNPRTKTRKFGYILSRSIPNVTLRYRNRSSIKKMVKTCKKENYTDIIVINEDKREPNGMVVIHLPDGPTAHFRLSNVKNCNEIKKRIRAINPERPEVILNNFGTRLGNTVSRMLAALFHYDPEFKGRRAVTFHNQRDYIFFRSHRYEFKSDKKVSLRELGPRFTMRLRSLQHGTFDTKTGEYEWIINNRRHAMETNRRTFFL